MTRIHDQQPPASPDFDPRVADWLEEDPDRAPDPVLETVLAAFPLVPQRRAPRVTWRPVFANRPALLGAAAALVAIVVGGSLLLLRSGPSQVASASSAPSASAGGAGELTQTYRSSRYGYSIHIPADWTATPATTSWAPGTETAWGDSALDVFQGPNARLVIASQTLAAGETADHWFVTYCTLAGSAPDACERYSYTWSEVPIGTFPGLIYLDGVPAGGGTILPGGPVYEAVTILNDRRAYEFTLDGAVTRSDFERLLATVVFEAGQSPGQSAGSPTASGP
jgi:hypothetical protein